MRKDIYVVTATYDGYTRLSEEGYNTIEDAISFIHSRADNPVKEPYTLTWVGNDFVYEIHLIKVGD